MWGKTWGEKNLRTAKTEKGGKTVPHITALGPESQKNRAVKLSKQEKKKVGGKRRRKRRITCGKRKAVWKVKRGSTGNQAWEVHQKSVKGKFRDVQVGRDRPGSSSVTIPRG